jgi:allophanate hydrolase
MQGWTIEDWRMAYRSGGSPTKLLTELAGALREQDDPAWISIVGDASLHRQLAELEARATRAGGDLKGLPLYGIPFAVKDNIDVVEMITTAACPAFAYTPAGNATAVQRLLDAGAIVLGKTNLDQFATGLVGVRSPYGIPTNSFDPTYISGGSSSGSASVVARGIVPFALGTDTAGSGRIPAGLNNIVGVKPTRGAVSTIGMVPACRTLDCISIFATSFDDALLAYDVMAHFDPADGLSRQIPEHSRHWQPSNEPRFGIPEHPEFWGDALSEQAYRSALLHLKAQGVICVPVDFSIFDEVAKLLYDGPWIAERYAAIREFALDHEAGILPVVRDIIFKAKQFSAADAFDGFYHLADLKRRADALLAQYDGLLVPTVPAYYKIAEVLADPVRLNSNLGKYTNFVNLLDWSAVSVPANLRSDGMPFGLSLLGQAWHERGLATLARKWHQASGLSRGATGKSLSQSAEHLAPSVVPPKADNMIRVAVVGAHLRGMPLNHELTSRGAEFVCSTRTAAIYRLFAIANTKPAKPGLLRGDPGDSIKLELWDVPSFEFGSFVAGVPAPLGIGTVRLEDGSEVKGFICEPFALEGAKDITEYGGWANYLKSLGASNLP